MKIKALTALLLLSALLLSGCSNKKEGPPSYNEYMQTSESTSPIPEAEENNNLLPEEEEIPYEKRTVIQTQSFSYDSAMFIFSYFSDIYNYVAPYSSYYGLDPTISLGRQRYFELDYSWKDYMVDQTTTSILNLLSVAEYAKSVGHEFAELDKYVDEQMELWYGYAEENSLTFDEYIKLYFGDRVTEEDIRNTFAIQFYAYTYNDIIKTDALENLPDNYYDSYYEKNKDSIEEVYTTKNVCHILLTEDTYGSDEAAGLKAEELLALFNSGEKTREAFEAVAEEYNEDSNCFYENVPKGKMVEEFENWIYDTSRTAGDTAVVKTSYGYHVMYFTGDGDPNWYEEALETYIQESLSAKTEEYYKMFNDGYTVYEDIGSLVPGMLPEGFIPE